MTKVLPPNFVHTINIFTVRSTALPWIPSAQDIITTKDL